MQTLSRQYKLQSKKLLQVTMLIENKSNEFNK